MIRQIKAPHPIPAILPHGPMQQQPVQPDAVKDWYGDPASTYAELTKQSVEVLLDLMGAEDATKAKLAKWEGGPQFTWKNAAGPKATDKVRTNPVSRAWHRTVSWLRDLTNNRPQPRPTPPSGTCSTTSTT